MNYDNNSSNETFDISTEGDHDHYSNDTTTIFDSTSFIMKTPSTPSTVEYDMYIDEDISLPIDKMHISTDEYDRIKRNQKQQEQHQQSTNSLSNDTWLLASSKSLLRIDDRTCFHAEHEIENKLFENIENLVREFLCRPNREYPYYRVIRWTIGEQPKLEHVVTVVINRPTKILE